ncbi:MAG: hypothetical protein Q9218_008230, partial [Villophora microphyllina]
GGFMPTLVEEYVVRGMKLDETAAGKAIDLDLAQARERNRMEIGELRAEYEQARQDDDEQATTELKALSQQIDARLMAIDAETEQLRTARLETQRKMDKYENDLRARTAKLRGGQANEFKKRDSETASVNDDDIKTVSDMSHVNDLPIYKSKVERRYGQKKRAMRWSSRFTALGGAVAMSVLTGGAMLPVGASLYDVVETACQADKDREAKRFVGKSPDVVHRSKSRPA